MGLEGTDYNLQGQYNIQGVHANRQHETRHVSTNTHKTFSMAVKTKVITLYTKTVHDSFKVTPLSTVSYLNLYTTCNPHKVTVDSIYNSRQASLFQFCQSKYQDPGILIGMYVIKTKHYHVTPSCVFVGIKCWSSLITYNSLLKLGFGNPGMVMRRKHLAKFMVGDFVFGMYAGSIANSHIKPFIFPFHFVYREQ